MCPVMAEALVKPQAMLRDQRAVFARTIHLWPSMLPPPGKVNERTRFVNWSCYPKVSTPQRAPKLLPLKPLSLRNPYCGSFLPTFKPEPPVAKTTEN
ncbi:hypothetical protein A6R68_01691, partial [Neotoma lepida]